MKCIVKRYTDLRIAHRISVDQTFYESRGTELRLRYRVSTEIPLGGQSLDPTEFFLKFNNEYLNSIHEKKYDLEIRGAGFIGYVVTPDSKIELGLDYRIDSFIHDSSRNRFWIGINFYQSI